MDERKEVSVFKSICWCLLIILISYFCGSVIALIIGFVIQLLADHINIVNSLLSNNVVFYIFMSATTADIGRRTAQLLMFILAKPMERSKNVGKGFLGTGIILIIYCLAAAAMGITNGARYLDLSMGIMGLWYVLFGNVPEDNVAAKEQSSNISKKEEETDTTIAVDAIPGDMIESVMDASINKSRNAISIGEDSIYKKIVDHIVDGYLSDDFEHISESINENYSFAQGARDGMQCYHMAFPDFSEFDKARINGNLSSLNKQEEFWKKDIFLGSLFNKYKMLVLIDFVQDYYIQRKDEYDPQAMFKFCVWEMINSSKIDHVKFGLSYIEMLDLSGKEQIKSIIRNLSLCDEFTLFGIFCMRHWNDAEMELLTLGGKVTGWGRIHVVKYIEPTEDVTRDWIFEEGILNNVSFSYSAYECYKKGCMYERLGCRMDDNSFMSATNIMSGLLDEGPHDGISMIEDDERKNLIHKYLLQFSDRAASILSYETVLDILTYLDKQENNDDKLMDECRAVLLSDNCLNTVKQALKEGKGAHLAEALRIDVSEEYFKLLDEDFDDHYMLAGSLMKSNENNVDRVVSIFAREYMRIRQENEDFTGYGSKEMSMVFCVQELKPYIGKGIPLLIMCLDSPSHPLRNMVLRVAESWIESGDKTILQISPELQEAFIDRLEKEESEELKLRIKGVLCNKVYRKEPIKLG